MINKYKTNNKDKQVETDAIAEQWVNLVLAQVMAKKLPRRELIKIKTRDE